MTGETLFAALGGVEQKYLKDLDLLYRTKPSWKKIVKKSLRFTGKLVTAAAVTVVVLGLIFLPGLFQNQEDLLPAAASSDEPIVIKVLSERGTQNGVSANSKLPENLGKIVSDFNLSHDQIRVEVSYLPLDENDRKIALQNLRTQIMSGEGPDVFLLPTGGTSTDHSVDKNGQLNVVETQTLFPDVELAMRNLYFADLSEYYDEDIDLNVEELQQDVMDAGVLNGARYVLPLGFDMDTVVVDLENLTALGMDTEIFSQGALETYAAIRAAGERAETELEREQILFSVSPPGNSLSLFPQVFDYEKGKSLISKEDWETLIDFYQEGNDISESLQGLEKMLGTGGKPYTWAAQLYSKEGFMSLFTLGMPMGGASLGQNAADLLGTTRTAGREAEVYPVRAIDGSLVAEVTYYGAVSAACEHPAQAYEFLRTFLTPAVQFQGKTSSGESLFLDVEDYSWPVRVVGSAQAKWEAARYGVGYSVNWGGKEYFNDDERLRAMQQQRLSDEDFAFLFEKIDHVRFSIFREDELTPWALLHEPDRTERPVEEAVKLAMDLLEYHIAEG